MTGDLNTGGHKIINLRTPITNNEQTTKNYVDSNFLKLGGQTAMTRNLNMNNNIINNLPLPTGSKQPTTLGFTDLKYLHLDGTVPMGGNLNMNNKKIIHLLQPTSDTDAATKKYVDNSSVNVSNYLKRDGTSQMTGDLNMNNRKIVNLNNEPTTETDGVNKNYVDAVVAKSHVKPSYFKDQFTYWMSNVLEWTDEMDGGNSFIITKIADYHHLKVIFTLTITNYFTQRL